MSSILILRQPHQQRTKALNGREGLEARGGIEPPIWVLQTHALPLGDRATVEIGKPRRASLKSGHYKPKNETKDAGLPGEEPGRKPRERPAAT